MKMTINVKISCEGSPNIEGKSWGYDVFYEGQSSAGFFRVRARSFENHYLLESRVGRGISQPAHLFGIEDLSNYETADKRLQEVAKKRANELMESLIPKLIDETESGKKRRK